MARFICRVRGRHHNRGSTEPAARSPSEPSSAWKAVEEKLTAAYEREDNLVAELRQSYSENQEVHSLLQETVEELVKTEAKLDKEKHQHKYYKRKCEELERALKRSKEESRLLKFGFELKGSIATSRKD